MVFYENQEVEILGQKSKICPYPGLRPFTEQESSYFKGRERHIDEIIEKLEKHKFLLVTGASGDGKSSLIYAGLIPNCQAGFFRAKYSNWAIASFRPQKTPLKNMAAALADSFIWKSGGLIENNLRLGFSALVDLYIQTNLHLDIRSEVWENADEEQQHEMKLNASNLLIIVDQFEELFTNSENFDSESATASEDTQIFINLLLELTVWQYSMIFQFILFVPCVQIFLDNVLL